MTYATTTDKWRLVFPLLGLTFATPAWAQGGPFVYVANMVSDNISAYSMDPTTGELTQFRTYASGGTIPRSVAVDPTGRFLYVANCGNSLRDITCSNPHNPGTIFGYSINPTTGDLTPVPPGIPLVVATNLTWSAVHPSGSLLYITSGCANVTCTDPGYVSPYAIDSTTGRLTRLPGLEVRPPGINSDEVTITPNGQFAYVSNFGIFGGNPGNVSGYTIDVTTGALSPIGGSPFARDIHPGLIAIDPTSNFAYVPDFQGGLVYQFSIDSTTGALAPLSVPAVAAGTNPFSVTVDSAGQFAYVPNFGSTNISVYSIDSFTGLLTEILGSPFEAGTSPSMLALDPSGQFSYAVNFLSSDISAYGVDPGTGALTLIGTFAAGVGPFSIVIR